MTRKFTGSAIPRHDIFVLQDGTSVVQWTDKSVQDILTGQFLPYTRAEFDHWIRDDELTKLQAAGRVEHFTQRHVWLYALPERPQPPPTHEASSRASHRIRAFYITTALPQSQLENVIAILPSLQLPIVLRVKIHDERVAIYGPDDAPFTNLQDAENVLTLRTQRARQLFQGASVAVYEMALGRGTPRHERETDDAISLDTLILALSDHSITQGQQVVMVVNHNAGESDQIEKMLSEDMRMSVTRYHTARQALPHLEDNPPRLALIDLNLPDIHGWEFIRNLREIRSLQNLHIIVLSSNPVDEVFAVKVARVAAYLPYPINLHKLREKIWLLIRSQQTRTHG